ncbi:MAG: hypothetical protein ACKPKO_35615, partial [Candidatus Fonsibacter sp.]
HQWENALDKFTNRAFSWRTAEQGLHHACSIYNTFVVSVLSHIWQVTPPPGDCYKLEKMAMNKLIPSPGAWTQPYDLWVLKEVWGFSIQITSIQHKAYAAAVSVCLSSAPDFKVHAYAIKKAIRNSHNILACAAWKDWYDSAFYLHLDGAYSTFEKTGISPSGIRQDLMTRKEPDGKPDQVKPAKLE